MGAIASQITSLTIVYSIVYLDADQRKHQSSASLAFVRGTHRGRGKMFPFDDVILSIWRCVRYPTYMNAAKHSSSISTFFKPMSNRISAWTNADLIAVTHFIARQFRYMTMTIIILFRTQCMKESIYNLVIYYIYIYIAVELDLTL